MAAKKRTKKSKTALRVKIVTNCIFCKKGTNPNYKDYKSLGRFLSDRAKIVGRDRTGICSKHQRRVTSEIKRARHLGLLQFRPTL